MVSIQYKQVINLHEEDNSKEFQGLLFLGSLLLL